MLYCGFDLSSSSFRTLILSAGFALLDHRFFWIEEQFLNPYIIYFVQAWVATEHDLPLSNEVEYVLASFPRIFDLKEAKESNN